MADRITRQMLSEFLKSPRAIRAFENQADQVINLTEITTLVESATSASEKLDSILAALEEMITNASITNEPINGDNIEIDDLKPREENGDLAAQSSDNVDITGGSVAASLSDDTATLLSSSATLSDGAGSDTGTLTNAPSAGDPTKWVAIDDDGTTRYIPTWT
jgi:hypothetical protein